ncbi:small integral membrane protein 29-like [Stegodyphus dumicola]|uniref:small integral membrane protein 29-like n=1 Tax=Stegodyphus dumicola TaxID=202533 RepID=UPI0015AA99E3|nr:small integral membrane protein 29-like [Stegodyphus dumicola]XP_035214719.1 small integral membrane protein 29-like [Stegodyphus dumicola]XP_035214720.1 small integral membrane protein 29-like [Stegodyphus dumicola]XP_035214721.1 small integral membrane protein 29-like [Stegodyphus dumicola]
MLMVSSTQSFLHEYNFTSIPHDELNISAVNVTLKETEDDFENFLLDFVIVPLTLIVVIVILVGLIVFLIRKKRLDKLRHHLMPLYSFDPAEEGEDWEAELLEEGTDHQMRGKNARPSEQPQLSFRNNL